MILLHGNNDTPFPTLCNPYGDIHDLASYLESRGYRASELWALGYQGDQCDLIADQTAANPGPATSREGPGLATTTA